MPHLPTRIAFSSPTTCKQASFKLSAYSSHNGFPKPLSEPFELDQNLPRNQWQGRIRHTRNTCERTCRGVESEKAISHCCRSDHFEVYQERKKCDGKTLDCSAIRRKLSKVMSVLETKSECSTFPKTGPVLLTQLHPSSAWNSLSEMQPQANPGMLLEHTVEAVGQ